MIGMLEGVPLKELRFTTRIKLQLGMLFLSVAMKLIPWPFWEEFAFQIYGEMKGGRAKDEANQRDQELQVRIAEYLAGRGSGEWPQKPDSQ